MRLLFIHNNADPRKAHAIYLSPHMTKEEVRQCLREKFRGGSDDSGLPSSACLEYHGVATPAELVDKLTDSDPQWVWAYNAYPQSLYGQRDDRGRFFVSGNDPEDIADDLRSRIPNAQGLVEDLVEDEGEEWQFWRMDAEENMEIANA